MHKENTECHLHFSVFNGTNKIGGYCVSLPNLKNSRHSSFSEDLKLESKKTGTLNFEIEYIGY